MGNLDQDIAKYQKDAKLAISEGDLLAGLGALAKIGGEASVLFTIAAAAIVAGGALSTIIGPLGLAIPPAALARLASAVHTKYGELNTRQRKGIAVILGILRGKIPLSQLFN